MILHVRTSVCRILTCWLLLLGLLLGCKRDSVDTTPDFLLQAWIWPLDALSVRTYDFTQLQSNGKRTVELRAWQRIGTLGWQSNQIYSYSLFEVKGNDIAITTASGYRENWRIRQHSGTAMTLESLDGRGTVTWYTCKEPGWPELVLRSMRGCR